MPDAPDSISPLQGWRLWLAAPDKTGATRLTSVTHPINWPVGEPVVATCIRRRSLFRSGRAEHPDVPAPVAFCRCGIYAINDPTLLTAFVDTNQGGRRYRSWVVGRAALWGSIVESDRGWRASHAYPKHLYVPTLGRATRAAEISEALSDYGIPVELLDIPMTPRLLKSLRALETSGI